MPAFTVHLVETISTAITVEAADVDAAIKAAYRSPKMPGSMGYGSFGDCSVDESGEWQPSVVTDGKGNEVWSDRPEQAATPAPLFADNLLNTPVLWRGRRAVIKSVDVYLKVDGDVYGSGGQVITTPAEVTPL